LSNTFQGAQGARGAQRPLVELSAVKGGTGVCEQAALALGAAPVLRARLQELFGMADSLIHRKSPLLPLTRIAGGGSAGGSAGGPKRIPHPPWGGAR